MEIRQIPLNELLLAPEDLAVRQGFDADRIKTLSKNIQQFGLLQPLLVRLAHDGAYEVIDGNRRLLALRMMGDDSQRLITCIVGNEQEFGKGAALSANIMREEMNPMDVYDVYANLIKSGTNEKAIAKAFGKTKKQIAQILVLAKLSPEIKIALREGTMSWETAQALTLVRGHERQNHIAFEAGDNDWKVREIVRRTQPNLAHALFDRDEYLNQGGTILVDLFSEQQDNKLQLCEDSDLFWKLQDEAIEKKIAKLMDDGWLEIIDASNGKIRLDGNWPWREQIKSKKERGKHSIFYRVDTDGEFALDNRARPIPKLIEKTKAKELAEKIEEAEKAGEPIEVAGGKPMSMTLIEQLKHVRSVQVKAALAANPHLAARVLLMMLMNGKNGNRYAPAATDMFWSACRVPDSYIEKQPSWQVAEDEHTTLAGLPAADAWSEAINESDDSLIHRLGYIATMAINAHYPGGGELINAILQQQPVHARAVWQPKAEFWKQTGRAFMLKILGEIAGETVAARFKNEKVKDLAQKMELWFTQPEKHSWLHFNGKDEPMPADMCKKFETWAPAILAIPDKAMLLAQIFHHDGLREQKLAQDVDDLPSAAEE